MPFVRQFVILFPRYLCQWCIFQQICSGGFRFESLQMKVKAWSSTLIILFLVFITVILSVYN